MISNKINDYLQEADSMNDYDLDFDYDYDTTDLEEAAAKSPGLMALAELYGLDPWDIGLQVLLLETNGDMFRD